MRSKPAVSDQTPTCVSSARKGCFSPDSSASGNAFQHDQALFVRGRRLAVWTNKGWNRGDICAVPFVKAYSSTGVLDVSLDVDSVFRGIGESKDGGNVY